MIPRALYYEPWGICDTPRQYRYFSEESFYKSIDFNVSEIKWWVLAVIENPPLSDLRFTNKYYKKAKLTSLIVRVTQFWCFTKL